MKNFINNIIQSRKKSKNQPWIESRLRQCIACSHNTKNIGKKTLKLKIIWQSSKLLNFIMLYKTKDLGQCEICTCPIAEMVKIPNQTCSMVFLNKEPKWKEEN
jgi:hypothetical protein